MVIIILPINFFSWNLKYNHQYIWCFHQLTIDNQFVYRVVDLQTLDLHRNGSDRANSSSVSTIRRKKSSRTFYLVSVHISSTSAARFLRSSSSFSSLFLGEGEETDSGSLARRFRELDSLTLSRHMIRHARGCLQRRACLMES